MVLPVEDTVDTRDHRRRSSLGQNPVADWGIVEGSAGREAGCIAVRTARRTAEAGCSGGLLGSFWRICESDDEEDGARYEKKVQQD